MQSHLLYTLHLASSYETAPVGPGLVGRAAALGPGAAALGPGLVGGAEMETGN